jgi:hypothetical protein
MSVEDDGYQLIKNVGEPVGETFSAGTSTLIQGSNLN